jgi:uncharacterized protein (TIGR03435 family)
MRAAVFALFASAALAQTTFESVSVKATPPGATRSVYRTTPGLLTIENAPLSELIRRAYNVHTYQISGGPAWLGDARFNITAKASGNPDQYQMVMMVRALLADRFKLKVHHESKEGTVYLLIALKGGAKLQPPAHPDQQPNVVVAADELPGTKIPVEIIKGYNASMAVLASNLASVVERPVIDRTGITGQFDFEFSFGPENSSNDGAPSIFSAIQKLGLKLESGKGPVPTLVIDHAEKPLEN